MAPASSQHVHTHADLSEWRHHWPTPQISFQLLGNTMSGNIIARALTTFLALLPQEYHVPDQDQPDQKQTMQTAKVKPGWMDGPTEIKPGDIG